MRRIFEGAKVLEDGGGNPIQFMADIAFIGGLGFMILFLPLSEGLKNVGYFLALGGWIVKRWNRGFRITFTPLGLFLSLYLFLSLLSATSAFDRWEGLRGSWDVFRPLSLFLMIVNDIETVPRILACLWLFIISTGIGVVWGLVDYLDGQKLRLEVRSLGYPNHTAWYLVIMLVLFISLLLLTDWPASSKVLVGVVAGMTLLALFLTYSRGGWMAFWVSLLFFSIALKRWKPILVVALFTLALVTFLSVTGRLWTRQIEMLVKLTQDENVLERFRMWRGALLSLKDHPLLGIGPRNFKNLDHERYGFNPTNHAHSLFLNVLAERGLLGFLSLLSVLICYVVEMRRRYRLIQNPLSRSLWYAAVGAFLTIVTAGLANTTLHSEGAVLFWSLTALLVVSTRLPGEGVALGCEGESNRLRAV